MTNQSIVAPAVPGLRDSMISLVETALKTNYFSYSPFEAKRTGNRYQPIDFGAVRLRGARTAREHVLTGLDLQRKRVLDLGSNLGELSRLARNMGATLVDGFEYDQFFIDIANLVNAAKGATRVSFHQRDITERDCFNEPYDVTLAFSVFTYIEKNIDKLAEITRHFLVLETHKLEGDPFERYIKPVARHFPYWALYAETDVGAARSREEKRAVVIFHRRPGPVRDFVHKRARLLPAGYQDFRQLDVERSNVPSFAAVFRQLGFSSSCPIGSYLDRAFHHVQTSDELRSGEDLRRGLGSATYWTWFLAGLRQFLDCGQVDRDNPYLACVKKVYREIKADTPTAKLFADDESAMQRVKLRLESAKRMLDRVDLDRDPIVIFEAKQSSLPITLCDRETGQAIASHAFDGYHRLFFATLLGLPTLPYLKVITHESGFLDPTSA